MNKTILTALAFSIISTSSCFCNVNSLIKESINGNSQAQLELAKHYEQKKYNRLMFHWYEKAAKNGNEQAEEILANIYFNRGDVDKAFKLAQKLSENNNKTGKSILAYYYCWGAFEIPVDKHLALKYAEESREIPLSKAVLSNYYLNGFWEINKDVNTALKLAAESFDEGCDEGGCIYNRICVLERLKNNPKYMQINNKLRNSEYIDGVINSIFVFGEVNQANIALKKIEPYIDNKSSSFYYLLAVIEKQLGNTTKSSDYYLKAAELWNSRALFDLFKACFNKRNIEEKDKLKAKNYAKLSLKSKQPTLIAKLYFLINEMNSYYNIPKEVLPDNINWETIIKEGADNGHPMLMALHAYNIGKNNSEYSKYMNQARKMGAIRGIKNCLSQCKDFKKWLEIGVELGDIECIFLMSKAKLSGIVTNYNSEEMSVEKDELKAIEYLKYTLKHGHPKAAYFLFHYYSKEIRAYLEEKNKDLFAKIWRGEKVKKDYNQKPKQNHNNSEKDSNGKKPIFLPNRIVYEENYSNNETIEKDNDITPKNIKDETDEIDIETYKKAYIYGVLSNCNTSRDYETKKLFNNIINKFNEEQRKELDDKVESLRKEIKDTEIEDSNEEKTLAANSIPYPEMEFNPLR